MGMNAKQTRFRGGTERAAEMTNTTCTSCLSAAEMCGVPTTRHTGRANYQSTYFQLLESHLPPTHTHKCMFYISPH